MGGLSQCLDAGADEAMALRLGGVWGGQVAAGLLGSELSKNVFLGGFLGCGKTRIEDRARVQLSTRNAGFLIGGSLRMGVDPVTALTPFEVEALPLYSPVVEDEHFEDLFPIEHGDFSVSYISFPQKIPLIWQFLLQLLDIQFFFPHQKNQAMWSG